MALNPDKLKFLLKQATKVEHRTYSGIIGQIFSYLDQEIKDNPIYDKYETERKSWENWPESTVSIEQASWEMPNSLDKAKFLAYKIYRDITLHETNYSDNFAFSLFYQKSLSDNITKLHQTFFEYFALAIEDISNANPEKDFEHPMNVKDGDIFIIHGHDNELKTEVLLLLKRANVNAFVLHERPDKNRTIIDKLIEETKSAGYAIALLTPDDLTADGANRARQNVILEIGYFLGKIGKERVRMVVKNNVEIPNDLQGILYEKYDEKGGWKIKLLKEIQAVGINVDFRAVVDSF